MRKNDLIKKLQALDGNPEVMLWNGFVGDFVHIGEVGQSWLVKQTRSSWMAQIMHQEQVTDADGEYLQELKSLYDKIEYGVNRYVTQEDIRNGLYKKKVIAYIDAKPAGKSSSDRCGSIDY